MAAGDFFLYDEVKLQLLSGVHDLEADTFKLAIYEQALNPAPQTTTVYTTTNEVTSAGTYTAGGEIVALQLSNIGTVVKVQAVTNLIWLPSASNTSTAYHGLLYNFTSAGKEGVGYLTLGGPIDMKTGDLTIKWNTSGLFTTTT